MRYIFSLLLLFPLVFLAACTTPASPLENGERLWRQQKIESYQIEVLVVNSIWHAQSYTILVENGEVKDGDTQCIPAPFEAGECNVQPFIAEDYTIPGLFAKARAESQKEVSPYLQINYDSTYGYPAEISYDDPEILDEDWSWAVTSFEILEP